MLRFASGMFVLVAIASILSCNRTTSIVSRSSPNVVTIITTSGHQLHNFYEGLQPNPTIRQRIASLPRSQPCGSNKPTWVERVSRKLGIAWTVKADCPSDPCHDSGIDLLRAPCPYNPNGSCTGYFNQDFVPGGCGYYRSPYSLCGSDDYCPCNWNTCNCN